LTGYNEKTSAAVDVTPLYVITGSGTSFTATKGGTNVTGAVGQTIQTVITAIRTNASGGDCVIQFGDGSTVLDTGTTRVTFNNTGRTWGAVTLTGKITSAVSISTYGVIHIDGNVSVTSTADITNTDTTSGGIAISNYSTGTLTITGGTVQATGNNMAVLYNSSTGTVNISGGTVQATTGTAVRNNSTGTVNISGGTVSATTGNAVRNGSTGKITVSQSGATPTLITSANTSSSNGTIFLAAPSSDDTNARLEITGGTVQNTSTTTGNAIRNNSTGSVTISGGTVSKAGTGNYAVYKGGTGEVTITGATIVGNNYGF